VSGLYSVILTKEMENEHKFKSRGGKRPSAGAGIEVDLEALSH